MMCLTLIACLLALSSVYDPTSPRYEGQDTSTSSTFPILSANFIHYIVISHGQHFDVPQSIPIPRQTGSSSCISFSFRATPGSCFGGFPVLSANISPYMTRRHLPIFFSSRTSCVQSPSSPSHLQRILRAAQGQVFYPPCSIKTQQYNQPALSLLAHRLTLQLRIP